MNELFSLIEKKDDRKLEKFYNPEEEVLKNIQGWSIRYGDQPNFDIEPTIGVEASELYLDVQYITVEQYLNKDV
ncbi:hypothetical protein IC582_025163 [Cucumis melo]